MTITPPDDGPSGSPLFDETISRTSFDDLRVAPRAAGEAAGRIDDDSGSRDDEAEPKRTAAEARSAAADLSGSAKDAGAQVASAGKEQATRVAKDAIGQARDLYAQATSQLSEQSAAQQQRAAGALHTFADDLDSMGRGADGGLAAELVGTLESRARDVADWLEQHSPEDALDEVKRFAARRPGTFIALAAATGVVAARLTKALVAESKADDESAATAPAVR